MIAKLIALSAPCAAAGAVAAPFAFISNHGSNNVSVIDTAADRVVATAAQRPSRPECPAPRASIRNLGQRLSSAG